MEVSVLLKEINLWLQAMIFYELSKGMIAWLQAIAWLSAFITAMVAAFKFIAELRQNRQQRAIDLKWKKASEAKELVKELQGNDLAKAALRMLDNSERKYRISASRIETIKKSEIAGRLNPLDVTEIAQFVRDAFDSFFMRLGSFEHYIGRGLIDFDDIGFPLEYYVKKLAEDKAVYGIYLDEFGFFRGKAFLKRFREWDELSGPAGTPNHARNKWKRRMTRNMRCLIRAARRVVTDIWIRR